MLTRLGMIGLCFVLQLILVATASAQIYRYQDASGKWIFTDQPPEGEQPEPEREAEAEVDEQPFQFVDPDLEPFAESERAVLPALITPRGRTPIERATHAVVKVETVMGSGSGFFVTNECHLVTNKHVIRPGADGGLKESERNLERLKYNVEQLSFQVDREQARLDVAEEELKNYRNYIDSMRTGTHRDKEEKQYNFYKKNYENDRRNLREAKSTLSKLESEYETLRSSLNINASLSALAKTFNVVLKNNESETANLVAISEDLDLALLKIEGCSVEPLVMDQSNSVYQTMPVYAIGSPLGFKDHVTAGIVTRLTTTAITMDAQILPGNSGGPLLNEKGEVIGVNTFKLSRGNALNEGFGIAIPITKVIEDFGQHLGSAIAP